MSKYNKPYTDIHLNALTYLVRVNQTTLALTRNTESRNRDKAIAYALHRLKNLRIQIRSYLSAGPELAALSDDELLDALSGTMRGQDKATEAKLDELEGDKDV